MRKLRYSSSAANSEEANINLTPLIDVVFVVLIIFILIAPLLEMDRVELASSPPQSQRNSVQENSPITIRVHADNSIWFNNKPVNLPELLEALKLAYKRYPHKIPQLFHDRKAYFESYQKVKNAVESTGFEQMDVILEPG